MSFIAPGRLSCTLLSPPIPKTLHDTHPPWGMMGPADALHTSSYLQPGCVSLAGTSQRSLSPRIRSRLPFSALYSAPSLPARPFRILSLSIASTRGFSATGTSIKTTIPARVAAPRVKGIVARAFLSSSDPCCLPPPPPLPLPFSRAPRQSRRLIGRFHGLFNRARARVAAERIGSTR